MLRNSPKTILWLLTLLIAVTGCQQEDIQFLEEPNAMGRIVLNLSDIDVYVDAQTRATLSNYDANDPGNYIFTLTPVDQEGQEGQEAITVSFTNNVVSVPAGDYKLKATTCTDWANSIPGVPTYSNTSGKFTIETGKDTKVTLDMGRPTNAKVTLSQENSFSGKYNNVRVTLTAGGRSVDIGNAEDCYSEAFFPEGTVSYSITAYAIKDSHVTDITGAKGSITVTAGNHHVITLTANTVSGEIIPLIGGTHNSTFD